MNKLIKNYIYNVLYQIFLVIVPLITAPYLTRVLSVSSLGVYDYINSIISVITTFGMIGLHSYGYREIAYVRNDKEKVSEVFTQIFILRIILLVLISIFYLPFSFFSNNRIYFLIQYALIISQFIDVSWVFIGFEELGIVSFRNFIAKLLTVFGIFIFVKSDEDLWIYFAIFAFVTLFTVISIFPLLKKYVSFSNIKIKGTFLHIMPSIKLFIPQVATVLYLQFDKIMLKNITHSSAQVAYYSYAEKIINIPLAIILALGTVMMPRFANLYSNGNDKEIQKYITKTIKFAMFLAIPMMFGLSSISLKMIPWYLGKKYMLSAYAIIIISPICIINALTNIFGSQYLTAINCTKGLTISYYGAAVANVILNALLIPHFDFFGAALATVICSFISLLIQIYYVKKNLNFDGIFINIMKNIISSIIMTFIIIVISSHMEISPVSTLIEVAVGIITYLTFNFILKEEMFEYSLMFVKQIIKRGDKK